MNNQNILFGYTPYVKDRKKAKNFKQLILMNVQKHF